MTWQEKVLEKIKNIKCLKQERGAIFVLTALLLPIMFGCLGIAYDVGTLYMHKARLQNVADAAALAGGRAYLESQKKMETETDKKDTVDDDTGGKGEKEYIIGGSQTQSGKHKDADKAADDYIYKNIVNLGDKVFSDKYSHYALNGIVKSKNEEGEETYTYAKEVFYRIGLYETVPLHFLPVIANKNIETVRAGSVAVIAPKSSGGLQLKPNASFSVFSNLFTYSNYFFTDQSSKYNEGKVWMAFVGDMVYTHGYNPGNYDYYYTNGDTNLAQHYYNNSGSFGTNSIVGNSIDDPVINSMLDITKYVSAFETKLNGTHVDAETKTFKASQINNYYNNFYHNDSYNNVYHLGIKKEQDSSGLACSKLPDGNFEIDFDEELKGDENIPIYIILDKTTQNYKLKGTKNTRRPVVIACLAKDKNMQMDNDFQVPCFKGIIYNPYIQDTPYHFTKEGQSFIGAIVAKNIKIDNSQHAKVRFEQKNWLENTGVYVDGDISNITQQMQPNSNDINNRLTSTDYNVRETLITIFKDIDANIEEHLADMSWFYNLSYAEKQNMYLAWRNAYNKSAYSSIKDLLWVWNGKFEDKGESEEGEEGSKKETLRLINYRTEYQVNENGTVPENKVMDPFIFETLGPYEEVKAF